MKHDPTPSETLPEVTMAVSGLPQVLVDAFTEKQVIGSNGKKTPLHSNIAFAEAEMLYRVVRAVKPCVSVEVGLAQGISALAILQALADNGAGVHHVIDPFQEEYGDVGLAMVARAGLDSRLQFHRKFAEEVIPSLPRLQFGFIDSSHLFDLTIEEFVMVDRKLDVGGMLAFHDMWMNSLQTFLRHVLANRAYRLDRSFDGPRPRCRLTLKQRIRLALLRLTHLVPEREKIFREEILRPWHSMGISNLVLIHKTGEDDREWTFHVPF
jgi:hypothetical protein